MAHATEILNAHAGIADRLIALLADFKEAMAKRAIYRETVRELSKLSLRELDDLGIARGEIQSIASKAAYGA
ncbi:DUF1127 domain-containing protein [Aliiroseovarius sp. KMU-50]|uniref:DUF1127 domain-containing protein n=1 Tax=Aliiroseovarius salicola TaxID=3009082 RepID=A0ABT4W0K5_9RHOB|nr:DUF1127 domain-containing protein [Aliiroseovarius sp. KMU-50]MDA5094043.1 DUF1127 domain-containing protein [Aliiroseovarius sp. KMU-50]